MKDYKRLTEKTIGCFRYCLKKHISKCEDFNNYDAFFDYSMAVKRLGELEDKIESGMLIEIGCCKDCINAQKLTAFGTGEQYLFCDAKDKAVKNDDKCNLFDKKDNVQEDEE